MEIPLASEYRMDVAKCLIFSVISCGIYNVYWNYRQFEAMNLLLGRREYDFPRWLLLSFVTCGLYHVYTEYRMGQDLAAVLKAKGLESNPNLAFAGLALSLCALTVVADAVYQHELNKLAA